MGLTQRQRAWGVLGVQVPIVVMFLHWMFRLSLGAEADPQLFQRLGSAMVASSQFWVHDCWLGELRR